MQLTFSWHEQKDQQNRKKHGIDFDEAKTVFGDPWSIAITDRRHSDSEARFSIIGHSVQGRLLVVVYTERASRIRLISCRKATKTERKAYEESEG